MTRLRWYSASARWWDVTVVERGGRRDGLLSVLRKVFVEAPETAPLTDAT